MLKSFHSFCIVFTSKALLSTVLRASIRSDEGNLCWQFVAGICSDVDVALILFGQNFQNKNHFCDAQKCHLRPVQVSLRPNPHLTPGDANATYYCEWECSHWTQVTSEELPAHLRARVHCGLGLTCGSESGWGFPGTS